MLFRCKTFLLNELILLTIASGLALFCHYGACAADLAAGDLTYGPYRLEVEVAVPQKGEYELSLDRNVLLRKLGNISGYRYRSFGFPFEGVRLLDKDGRKIGQYQYCLVGENILKDPEFLSEYHSESPWVRLKHDGNRLTSEKNIGRVLWTRRNHVENTPVYQIVELKNNADYLMEADVFSDVQAGNSAIRLYRSAGGVFAQMPDSYLMPLAPQGKWIRQRRFVHAVEPVGHLRLNNVVIGTCGFANPSLTRIEWKLVAKFEKAGKQTIYLDICPHRGLEMTSPEAVEELCNKSLLKISPERIGDIRLIDAEDEKFSAACDDGKFRMWSLDSAISLETSLIAKSIPEKILPNVPVGFTCARGEKRISLLGVWCESGRFRVLEQKLEGLPENVSLDIKRLAAVNVYQDWTQRRRLQRRFDPMVEMNDPLVPQEDSPGVLCLTVAVPPDAEAGDYKAKLLLKIKPESAEELTLTVPLAIKVLPVTSKPMNHFRINFAGQLLCIKSALGLKSVSAAEFHGYPTTDLSDRSKMRKLFEAYLDSMLEFCIQPMSLMGFVPLTVDYLLLPDGTVKLDNWDFSAWDKVLDEYVTGKGATFINLLHTNGSNCSRFSITTVKGWQGFTYDSSPKAGYLKLDKKAFDKLLGDYFDAIARHLDEKNMLDNAYICFDESPVNTYEKIRDFGIVVKNRPYAKRIKIYHTLQHTAFYTKTLNGKNDSPLMLQGIFDIVAPEMDDAGNYYSPSNWINGRGTGPDPTTWVYYVDTERLRLDTSGLSTLVTPMQLETYGVNGFHHWVLRLWDLPYKPVATKLPNGFAVGPSKNPWINPHYHHGPGLLSFYYPPDPKGISKTPTNKVIPSYRLALLREGIQDRALLEMLKAGHDDAGRTLKISQAEVKKLRDELSRFWLNPVQWKLNLPAYRKWKKKLYSALIVKNNSEMLER